MPLSVVAERVDELALVHVGASLDTDLPGALLQLLLGPVLVAAGLPAALPSLRARSIGDPGRLLLALPLLAQPLVLLVVLDARHVVLGHDSSRTFAVPNPGDLRPAADYSGRDVPRLGGTVNP